MGYEFGEVPVSKKKSSKLRNLFIAALLFISIVSVHELAAANISNSPSQISVPKPIFLYNFSHNQISENKNANPPEEIETEPEIFQPAQADNAENYNFVPENFLFENKSEPIQSPAVVDVGILSLIYGNSSLTAQIKNYAAVSIDDELCLNISSKKESAFLCSNFTIAADSISNFVFPFPFSEGGYYNASIYLNRADDNPANDNFSLKIKYGQIHDLAIENLTLVRDAENPLKINIKVRIVNNGDFNETGLVLFANVNNQTQKYPVNSVSYDYIIRSSRTFPYSRTFNQSIPVSAIFSITNYSNFAEDADEENNIKSSSIHVG
ncbi:TPA: hypothetical protein H1009_02055 [archaeon]|nr:hypothetical protein [Candidatus Naiadarchaeales archaeon SRR2090153.bin461]